MAVLVVGAGLAGCTAALELAAQSVAVVLVDGGRRVMDGASRFNEGKIHLGYVYAKDGLGRTVDLMQDGAGSFMSILARHAPDGLPAVPASDPFDYVVHPHSQVSRCQLEHSYRTIDEGLATRRTHRLDVDYLGRPHVTQPRWRTRSELSELGLSGDGGVAAYATEERALEPYALCDVVAAALFSSTVETRCGVDVVQISYTAGAYWATTSHGTMGPFQSVINASWGSRNRLDYGMGIVDAATWNYRFKYFLRVSRPDVGRTLGCLTWAVGAFGDVVTYGDDLAYLSWYPAGRVAMATEHSSAAIRPLPTIPSGDDAARLKAGILSGLAKLMPAIGSIDPRRDDIEVRGGLIVGTGSADIDDPSSGLHRRENINVVSVGDYHSISSGKLTTAPLMGARAAALVLGR